MAHAPPGKEGIVQAGAQVPEAAGPPADDRAERVNILLVDDQPNNLRALEAILDQLGENLVRANSGAEALRHLLHDDFALILMDVQMPGMGGLEVAELVRGRDRTR